MEQKDRALRAGLLQQLPVQAQAVIGRQKNILRVLHQRDTRENFLRLVLPAPLGDDRGLCKIRDGAAAAGKQEQTQRQQNDHQ